MALILSALPDAKSARKIADLLVGGNYAACVTAIHGARSTFRWKGRLERSSETLILIKAPLRHYLKIEGLIRKHHPYELPEILRIPVSGGSSEYLSWVCQTR